MTTKRIALFGPWVFTAMVFLGFLGYVSCTLLSVNLPHGVVGDGGGSLIPTSFPTTMMAAPGPFPVNALTTDPWYLTDTFGYTVCTVLGGAMWAGFKKYQSKRRSAQ